MAGRPVSASATIGSTTTATTGTIRAAAIGRDGKRAVAVGSVEASHVACGQSCCVARRNPPMMKRRWWVSARDAGLGSNVFVAPQPTLRVERRQRQRRIHQRGGAGEVEIAIDVLLHQERRAAIEFFVLLVTAA